MKDDEYFGFSSNGDFKSVNLPDSASEDDLNIIELLDFSNEEDIRIVSLDDVEQYCKHTSEPDTGRNWIERIESVSQQVTLLPSSSALMPQCTHTRHMVKSVIVSVLIMMGLLVFLGNGLWLLGRSNTHPPSSSSASSASQSTMMAPSIAPPANAAPFVIDTSHYYIQFSVGWAQVLLDGHALLHVPMPGVDAPLWIAGGHHLVMWQMSDHQIYSCTITVPPSLTDTCDYNGPEPLQNGISVWIITLPHSGDGD